MKSLKHIIIFLFLFSLHPLFCRDPDSLRTQLKKTEYNDTSRISILLELGETEGIFRIGFWDSLRIECKQKLNGAKNHKTFYLRKLGTITNNYGYVLDELGNMSKALDIYNEALDIFKTLNDKKSLARVYNNIGSIHASQGNYNASIDNYYKSLKIREEIKDLNGMVTCNINIGYMYFNQKDYTRAIKYYNQGIVYAKKTNLMDMYAVALTNLGITYSRLGDNDKALQYYLDAKKIQDTIHDPIHLCNTYNNLGFIYKTRKDYRTAINYYQKSLRMADSLDYKRGKAVIFSNLGEIYNLTGELKKAKTLAEQGLQIARGSGYANEIKTCAGVLSSIYEQSGDFKEALTAYKLSQKMSDSLNNEDAKRATLEREFQHAYEKKTATDSLNMLIERKSNESRIKEEKTKRNVLYGGLILTIFLGLFIYNRLQITQKQNKVIIAQKTEVEEKNTEIIRQKELLQEKQKEIIDSITYAKRIQQAVLTGNDVWQKIAGDHFILFQPRDIVSGDFYWAYSTDTGVSVFALADCTAHGVPGACMSMLGNSFLNEIIVENRVFKADMILNHLRKKVISALGQEKQSNQKDGMDISLCVYDKNNKTLEFAGANNPLWIITNGNFIEFKGNKMPIGTHVTDDKPFESEMINVNTNDCIYLITDGFADQFGGDKGKKFKYKPLMELILKHQKEPMSDQNRILSSVINEWKKGYEQVDDISIIGFRI